MGAAVPFTLYLLMKSFGGKTSLIELLCIYGYSFSSFVVTLLLCAIMPNVRHRRERDF